jgi:hypothetical protein
MTGEIVSNPWVLALIPLVFSGIGAYFGSYLKKKGENLATREDIKGVLEQVRAVTTVTKEIEAKISSEVWDKQRRWELKRDILLEAAKRLANAAEALKNLDVVLRTEIAHQKREDDIVWTQLKVAENNKWFAAAALLDESRLYVSVTCETETAASLDNYRVQAIQVAGEISQGKIDAYIRLGPELMKAYTVVKDAIRKELGIDSRI